MSFGHPLFGWCCETKRTPAIFEAPFLSPEATRIPARPTLTGSTTRRPGGFEGHSFCHVRRKWKKQIVRNFHLVVWIEDWQEGKACLTNHHQPKPNHLAKSDRYHFPRPPLLRKGDFLFERGCAASQMREPRSDTRKAVNIHLSCSARHPRVEGFKG